MKLPISSILFAFLPSNKGNMPNGKSFQFAKSEEIKRAMKRAQSSKGSISESSNFEKLTQLVDTLVSSRNTLKSGSLFITIASLLKDSLVNNGKSEAPLTHTNENISNGDITIQKTYVKVGRPYTKKIKAFLQGPVHDIFTKTLQDTRKDYLNKNYKAQLYSKAGINQRNYTFLDKDFFLTLADVIELTDFHSSHKKNIENAYKTFLMKTLVKPDDDDDMIYQIRKRFNTRTNDVNMVRYYSALLGQETVIKIYNRLPVYEVHAILSMVRFNRNDQEISTIDELIEEVIWRNSQQTIDEFRKEKDKTSNSYKKLFRGIEKIPEKKIKVREKSPASSFSQQLHTTLDVNLTESEAFRRHCSVVKQWKRIIPSGGSWEITVEELFGDGIYLNRLYELLDRKTNTSTPLNHFFMVEYFGDRRASVYRNKDEETFVRVYSPVLVGYDCKLSIKHLSKPGEQDEIMSYQKISKSTEFIDDSLGSEFYPTREESFNVNFDKITITKNQKEHEFKLELNSSILENEKMSELSNLFQKLKKIDPETAKTLSEDDLEFKGTLSSPDIESDDEEENKFNLEDFASNVDSTLSTIDSIAKKLRGKKNQKEEIEDDE